MPSAPVACLILKPGRERSVARRHPWIYSGAVDRLEGTSGTGETVRVEDARGGFLAWAALSPASQLVARVWSFDEATRPGPDLIRARVASALALRRALLPDSTAVRLLNAESDGLPGVICDRYGDQLVLALSSAGAQAARDVIADSLVAETGLERIYERSEGEVLELEGIAPRSGVLRGATPEEPVPVDEHGLRYAVSVTQGHKTGFYLDQRDNRLLVRELAAGREVLDCFCYTGGFSLNALAGGARGLTAIEASADALALARINAGNNALDLGRADWIEGNVFQLLRRMRDQARHFDLIILDPPKFAPTAALAERAARGYKDINLLAFKLLRPGGLLLTFSCSGGVSPELFRKIVAGAALDARVAAQVVLHLGAGRDHPVALGFPEGEYLKGLLCIVG